jgi:hypothetical protein
VVLPLTETKYSVVKSVRDYADNRMDMLRRALGKLVANITV